MANSTSNIDNLIASQVSKEITANAFFDAASQATRNGRRASTSGGLVWGVYGGNSLVAGVPTFIANSILTLPASSTIFIEAAANTGIVYQNVSGFTPGRIPLYMVVTSATSVASYTDLRAQYTPTKLAGSLAVTGNTGFQSDLSLCDIVTLTGSPTAGFTVTIPVRPWEFTIRNATGQIATFTCGVTNTVAIGVGKIAKVMTDGTDVFRVTADI
jgi:hypothetical protein